MNLAELKKDVFGKEPTIALPCNLSDFWLDSVAGSLEQVLENPGPKSGQYLAGPLALVLHLLFGRSESVEFEVDYARLLEYVREYRIEVTLETVNKRTNVRTTSATLETIFKHPSSFDASGLRHANYHYPSEGIALLYQSLHAVHFSLYGAVRFRRLLDV